LKDKIVIEEVRIKLGQWVQNPVEQSKARGKGQHGQGGLQRHRAVIALFIKRWQAEGSNMENSK
jgi:hypothetical protein